MAASICFASLVGLVLLDLVPKPYQINSSRFSR